MRLIEGGEINAEFPSMCVGVGSRVAAPGHSPGSDAASFQFGRRSGRAACLCGRVRGERRDSAFVDR